MIFILASQLWAHSLWRQWRTHENPEFLSSPRSVLYPTRVVSQEASRKSVLSPWPNSKQVTSTVTSVETTWETGTPSHNRSSPPLGINGCWVEKLDFCLHLTVKGPEQYCRMLAKTEGLNKIQSHIMKHSMKTSRFNKNVLIIPRTRKISTEQKETTNRCHHWEKTC